MKFSLICASNNGEILAQNFLRSDIAKKYPAMVMSGYTNVQKAYNEAMKAATGDVLCFVHQDVFLPPSFESDLNRSLECLKDQDWGVLGPAGQSPLGCLGHIVDRGTPWGSPVGLPAQTQTLDELLLIIKKDTFKFDESMPNYHLFGADLCMQANEAGKQCFAIDTLCYHNSINGSVLPGDFHEGVEYMARKWAHKLPIYTTCTLIK